MKKLFCLLILASTVSVAQQTTRAEGEQSVAKFREIDSLLTYLNANKRFMGSLAIRQDNKVVFAKAYGFADVETNKKLDENTKLKIGSITKTFTATMIMQLVDEKKLTLDTKLSKFYPKIANADKITIHYLLHHRSGIPDFLNDDPNVGQYIYIENKKEDLIKRIESYTPAFEPNSQYKYSNSNYNLLGYILEDITKKSFEENLESRIIKKLDLKNTRFPKKIDIARNEGYSYRFNGTDWEKNPEWDSSMAFSSGAIISTPNDLNAFLNALFDGKLVSKQSLELMKTMEDTYGMGLFIAPFGEKKFYGHTGGIESYRAAVSYSPDENISFAIIVNGDNYDRNDIMIGVLSLFYGKPYTFPDVKGHKVSAESIHNYVGMYSSKTLPLKISVTEVDGELFAQATGQSSFPLYAKSETVFVFDPARVKMVFGQNKFTLIQGGVEYEYTKD